MPSFFDFSEADRVMRVGSALAELQASEGFQQFLALIDAKVTHAGLDALEDDEHGKDYWKGYVKFGRDLRAAIDMLVAGAQAHKEALEDTGEEIAAHRGGSSELAI